MGAGDILLLHTDGFVEHARDDEPYFPQRAEALLRTVKDHTAREILDASNRRAARRRDVSMVVKLISPTRRAGRRS
jgi:serine phosphatase RsbU (regulator of sigma subunit)